MLALVRLRVVTAAQRAALVEDLLLDAIEGAGRRRIAGSRGVARHRRIARRASACRCPCRCLPPLERRQRHDLDLLLGRLADVAGKRTLQPARGCWWAWCSGRPCWSASRSGCRCGSAAPGTRCRTSDRRCRARGRRRSSSRRSSVQCAGSKVLLAQTPTWKTHSPFTTPSASQLGSPSVQRTFFGLVGGSLTGASSASRQSVLELPPPPMTIALATGAVTSNTPATIASDRVPPRMAERLSTGTRVDVNGNRLPVRGRGSP